MSALSTLIIEPLLGGEKYKVKEKYRYGISGKIIEVPVGFITDLASTPKLLWISFPPFGKYTPAAIVHDYLYSKESKVNFSRLEADNIFIAIMKELGVGVIKRNLMYYAVRSFGWKFYKK